MPAIASVEKFGLGQMNNSPSRYPLVKIADARARVMGLFTGVP
ncbi:hypothetical protein COO91_09535 (plasmid) [Nostoc flagelliforme CCNUN1]|uniref:Uncharacterized protein n=1 Tax=Nostoc flagelliforme CCNUN1 TaxID=2038116 RepID=A0A2K8T6U2_9NOSO|nr:hypothetical protein COO91_09535 [Nostoc flagelliforme CCNUN1]